MLAVVRIWAKDLHTPSLKFFEIVLSLAVTALQPSPAYCETQHFLPEVLQDTNDTAASATAHSTPHHKQELQHSITISINTTVATWSPQQLAYSGCSSYGSYGLMDHP